MLFIMYSIFMGMISILIFFMSLNFLTFNELLVMEWLIMNMNTMKFNFIIYIDYKSLMFMSLVMMISSLIINYSYSYMNMNDFNLMKRFLYLLILFIISMCLMIISPSILSILLGWDGLGLISYCLIIYYQNFKAYNAGILTIILNRLGDSSLLMMIGFMSMFGSWNLFLYSMNFFMMILMLLMMMTKSAQLPFSSWLPAAMMAPTPISSLVHSSTLVTAGVYLLIRYIDLFNNLNMNNFILIISSMTMLFSGIMANLEMDLKKIIAYSTLSQLGFMLSIVALNLKDLAFLHLLIHAMFKSLMFLCVGSLIHYFNNTQDFRNYSGVMFLFPFKSMIMIFSLLSLCGMPFLVGFYSKDLMIENFMISKMNMFSIMNLMLATIMTISYSIQIIMMFSMKIMKLNIMFIKIDYYMNIPMMILMLMGLFMSKLYFNMNFMFHNLNMSLIYKYFILKMMFLGMIFSWIFFNYKKKIKLIHMNNFKKMLYLNFFEMTYKNLYMNILNYELKMEKSMFEILMSKIMYFFIELKFNFNFLHIFMMMMIYLLFMLMFMFIF